MILNFDMVLRRQYILYILFNYILIIYIVKVELKYSEMGGKY